MNFTATSAEVNPGFIWNSIDLTGVGWDQAPDLQYALVSRQHLVFATHFAQPTPRTIRFLNASGTVLTKTIQSKSIVQDGGVNSDLTLMVLSSPIDEGNGVSPLPYLDLPTAGDYAGLSIGIIGHSPENVSPSRPVGGMTTIKEVETTPRTVVFDNGSLNPSVFMRFDYKNMGDVANVYFESGDSGSPTFVPVGTRAALVGIHSYVAGGTGSVFAENYDTFVPHYITQLDAEMAPLGYRMRPVNAPATTLSGSASVVESTPRRLHPLTLEFDIANTGANLTGNLEVEFQFPAGQEPDTVSAAGWVTYGSGAKWTLRKATLAASASATLTAAWAGVPDVESLSPTLVWRSDTVADQNLSPVIALGPSYSAWSAGLAEPGEQDDPDDDNLVNLLEYAFGGDPESGVLTNVNGDPLLPTLSSDGSIVTLRFPERDDAVARGLTYTVWHSSTGLDSWTDTAPAGAGTSTAPYVPDIDGFVERTVTWPDTEAKRFVRVTVTLDE